MRGAPAAAISARGSLSAALLGAVVALCTFLPARAVRACWCWSVTLLLSWEWGHVVRPRRDVDVVARRAWPAVGDRRWCWRRSGYVGLGLLALPIGAHPGDRCCSFGDATACSRRSGVLYVGLPAVALIWLRGDVRLGPAGRAVPDRWSVIATDTARFLAGRLIGGPKLWPRVSPNKTWAGLVGGVVGAARSSARCSGSRVAGASPVRLAVTGAMLALVAQAGDLAELAMKRRFGVKDASALIPGHGGVHGSGRRPGGRGLGGRADRLRRQRACAGAALLLGS